VNVARLHDRLRLIAPATLWVQATLNSALAIAQDLRIASRNDLSLWVALVLSPPSNQGFKGISSLCIVPFDSNHASLRPSNRFCEAIVIRGPTNTLGRMRRGYGCCLSPSRLPRREEGTRTLGRHRPNLQQRKRGRLGGIAKKQSCSCCFPAPRTYC
jgi:hypothetical protein